MAIVLSASRDTDTPRMLPINLRDCTLIGSQTNKHYSHSAL